MGRKQKRPPARPSRRWRWMTVGALALVLAGGGAAWWIPSGPRAAEGGTPHMTVDRDVIDLGYLRFNQNVSAVFTLTNTGDGALKLAGVPRVHLAQGC